MVDITIPSIERFPEHTTKDTHNVNNTVDALKAAESALKTANSVIDRLNSVGSIDDANRIKAAIMNLADATNGFFVNASQQQESFSVKLRASQNPGTASIL